ncbi:hypothetical protein BEP19_07435 [Ammoniphilus oxalaticus]|uniref:Copper amine oxidase-like N-terminal domain-containing protein n=1 Tax=Ammoniphilus oxalaticus TaxID=66863 RepID=A0A419SJW8_9BACL|nr:copper amine oxidase N-terminal domain-containing protein [Ammoniphilus oxalaticus]RKD24229.1 hypothetical protein BEP19_07435 [Ammoniphilus oxalaticus]
MRIVTKSLLCLSLLLTPYLSDSTDAAGATLPVITLNGDVKAFQHPPRIINGRTFLPMRETLESLGATVSWDPKTRTVTAIKQGQTAQLKLGSNEAYVNNRLAYLEEPARLINDITFVPLRFIGQALGASVTWDEQTRTVSIVTESEEKELESDQAVTIWNDEHRYQMKWLHEQLLDLKDQMDRFFDPTSDLYKIDRHTLGLEIREQVRSYKTIFNRAESNSQADARLQSYLREYATTVDLIEDAVRWSSSYRTKANQHIENAQALYNHMVEQWSSDKEATTIMEAIKTSKEFDPFLSDQHKVSYQLIKREESKATVHFIIPPSADSEGYSVTYQLVSNEKEWIVDRKTNHRERVKEDELITAIERRYRTQNFKDVSVKRLFYDSKTGVYHATVFSSSRKGGWTVFADPFSKELWEK